MLNAMYLREYFSAVSKTWVGLLSGIASIVLSFYATYWTPSIPESKTILWTAAILCFLLASYKAWAFEHKRYLDERAKLGQPDIQGEIQDFFGASSYCDEPQALPGEPIKPAIGRGVFDYYCVTVRVHFATHT